jgi:UDP-N-acetylglucosamine 2-epimerase
VTLLLVGNSANIASLARELDGADLTVERWPEDSSAGGGAEEVAAIARELRKFETALDQDGPHAILLASDSSAALAAVLVATKLGAPVGRIELSGEDSASANADLIRHLADVALAPKPAAIVDWVRNTYTPRG